MNGVLQQAPKQKTNPMLDRIIQQSEAHVPENMKSEYLSIMTVGGKLMWSDEMTEERQAFDQALQQHGNVPEVVSHTVIKIISIIQNESKRDKPLDAVGLAAPVFMAHILQYVESKHGMEATKEIIDETAQLLQVNLLKMYGVTEQHIQQLLQSKSALQADVEAPEEPGPLADEKAEAPIEDEEEE